MSDPVSHFISTNQQIVLDRDPWIGHSKQMENALRIYLSDMSESAKLAAIRAEFIPLATMLDSMTGSDIVGAWGSEDLEIDVAFVAVGWI